MAESIARYLESGGLPVCGLTVARGEKIGHIVPQRISGTKDVHLSLRVNTPLSDCVIQIRQAGKPIQEFHRERAIPAEMLEFVIPAEKITKQGDLEVTVR